MKKALLAFSLLLCLQPATILASSLTTAIKQQMILMGVNPLLTKPDQHEAASFISNKGNTTDLSLRELYWNTYQDSTDLKEMMVTQQEDGSWPGIDLQDSARSNWQPANLTAKLLQLGRAYITPGSDFYQKQEVSTVLHRGINYWFRNKPVCRNWWYNEIYIPKTLGLLFLFIEHELTAAEKAEALVVMNHSGFRMTGQNKVWQAGNVLMKGLLFDDEALVKQARDSIASEIFQTLGEGIQPDFSFHQHGPQQQLGNYGLAYISSMAYFANVFENSTLSFSPTQIELLRRYLLEGESTVVWRGRMDISACNRQLFKQAQRGKALSLCVAASLMQQADKQYAEAYQALINRNITTAASPELSYSKHFWRSDLTVYRNSNHYLSIRACSPRVIGTEFTNNENKKGHFISDGLTLLVRRGDEYEDIFPVWDWNRLPGVTAPILDTIVPKGKGDYRNPNPFVGGLTHLSGGISTFSLDRNRVTAKKSWFYFNGLLVSMGADIQSKSGREIVTGVSQTLKKTPTIVINRNGEKQSLNDTTLTLNQVQAVWIDSTAYIFPNQKGVMVADGTQSGDWHDIADPYSTEKVSAKISKLWISHGKNAALTKNYCYFTYPNVTLQKLQYLLKMKEYPTTFNQSDVQWVKFGEKGPLQVVFHQPATVGTFDKKNVLKALNPGLVMLEKTVSGGLIVTVADPTCQLQSFRLVLSGEFQSGFSTYDANKRQTELTIPLPTKGEAGKAVTLQLRKK
ncbi:MAG TPA: polysaccharide lyase family 8 super-sandwich domain-containing protein [Bacteroidales bacterium]|nr:polysaccharide lyase family 8 super-sandwich domain-containing protein [Bacteroidales bacterium]